MTASSLLPAPNLMPLLRYRDLAEAMGWLETAFAFEKQIAVSDSDGAVIYGQMSYRGGLLMMGAVRDTDLDKLMCQPDEVGGVETQSCYIVVDDADAHYAKALEAGAEVVLELKSDGLGRRGYSCRDPEGHIWNFGTYNPGRGLTMTVAAPAPATPEPPPAPRRSRKLMSLSAVLLAVGAAGWWFAADIRADLTQRLADVAGQRSAQEAERAYAELVKVRAEKREAEARAKALAANLKTEQERRTATETSSQTASQKLSQEQSARQAAEAAVASLRDALSREQKALDEAIEAKRVSEEKLAVKSAAVEAAAPPSAPPPPAATQEPAQATAPAVPSPTASPAPARASEIETSSMGPANPPAAVPPPATDAAKTAPPEANEGKAEADEDDDAPRAAVKSAKDAAKDARRAAARNNGAKGRTGATKGASRRLPAYATDVQHTWPYNSWSN